MPLRLCCRLFFDCELCDVAGASSMHGVKTIVGETLSRKGESDRSRGRQGARERRDDTMAGRGCAGRLEGLSYYWNRDSEREIYRMQAEADGVKKRILIWPRVCGLSFLA